MRDDDRGNTSLSGVTVWPVQDDHPLGFYLRLGYVPTGIIPDANGRGFHDFMLARRLGGV